MLPAGLLKHLLSFHRSLCADGEVEDMEFEDKVGEVKDLTVRSRL